MDFKSGDKVKISFKVSEIRFYEIFCFIKWCESDRIVLAFPKDKEKLKRFLIEGNEIKAQVRSDKGLFSFDSIVIDSPYEPSFVIELPEEQEKIQRRKYLRYPFNLDMLLGYLDFKLRTKTVNIGGGGIRFESEIDDMPKGIETGELWSFSLYNPIWRFPISGLGQIIFTEKQDKKVISVIKFTDIDESDRNKIIKLCFDEEAKHLKLK